MPDDQQNLEAQEEQTPERPGWLPEKYDTPEAFASAYGAAERKIQEQSDQLAELKQAVDGFQAQTQQQQQQADPEEYRQQLLGAYEEDPLQVIAWASEQAANRAVQQFAQQQLAPQLNTQNELMALTVDQAMERQYPDWAEKKDKVAQAIKENPYLLPQEATDSFSGTLGALSNAYEVVAYRDLQTQAAEQGATAQDLARQQKLAAQTMTGAGGLPGQTDSDEEFRSSIVNARRTGYDSLVG